MNEATRARANTIIMQAQHANEHAHTAYAKTCARNEHSTHERGQGERETHARERSAQHAREEIGSTTHGERTCAH